MLTKNTSRHLKVSKMLKSKIGLLNVLLSEESADNVFYVYLA